MKWLDESDDIVSFSYESIKIQYVSNVKTKRTRNYIPDFIVERKDGTRQLVEIKPKRQLTKLVNKKKFSSARDWCELNGCEFVILTEVELNTIGLL